VGGGVGPDDPPPQLPIETAKSATESARRQLISYIAELVPIVKRRRKSWTACARF
jgi:hypothetical protein